jgi:DNA mismatch endonuclease, patch repair protein
MSDVFSKTKRSDVMSRIRSRGNKDTELALARLLRTHRITGWRRQILLKFRSSRGNEAQTENRKSSVVNRKSVGASSRRLLQVRPDFVFRQARLAIFVDGCFWHGCPQHATQPKSNAASWRRKLSGNKQRDALVTRTLRGAGWRVLRVWEHDLRRAAKRTKKASTPHPGPLPGRGGAGAEARLLRRIQRILIRGNP